jgi:acyl-CoA thioesterase-1
MTCQRILFLCFLAVGSLAGVRRASGEDAAPATYLAPIVAELERVWPGNRTVNIVCHGHSVPAGYFRTPHVDSLHAYPALLHRALKERFPHAVINVIVTAIGGETSPRGAARFEREVLTHRPDIVCLDYSLNDRGPGLAAARAAWTEMITKAQAAGAKVILLTPTPDQRNNFLDETDALHQHADQVRALARRHGVALVDALARFTAEVKAGTRLEDLMSQVNHPNARGHQLVADALAAWFPASPPAQKP